MISASRKILEALVASREMTVRDVATLIPRHTNDHRDFYILANLIKNEYADVVVKRDDAPFRENTEMEQAITLYVWATKGKEDLEYQGMRVSGADFRDEKVFATAKAELLLDEIRAKRSERIWAFSAAILTAAIASMLTSMLS